MEILCELMIYSEVRIEKLRQIKEKYKSIQRKVYTLEED